MEFKIPESLTTEHDHLHADLVQAIEVGGEVGAAAQAVADLLHHHFEAEEAYALPPLALLSQLAEGKVTPDMAEAIGLAEKLKAELPHMLDEHKAISAALMHLKQVALAENKPEIAHFADALRAHAQSEEEIAYPTAILIGEYLKLRLN